MLSEQQAQTFAKDWIESWNSHDLDRILTHYSDDFEITTPMIKAFLGIDTGTLQGKQNIKEYWAAALEKRRTRKLGFSEALLDHIVTDPKMCAAMVPSDTRDAALPPTILAEFLKLNRSDLDEAPLQAAKTALIEEAA